MDIERAWSNRIVGNMKAWGYEFRIGFAKEDPKLSQIQCDWDCLGSWVREYYEEVEIYEHLSADMGNPDFPTKLKDWLISEKRNYRQAVAWVVADPHRIILGVGIHPWPDYLALDSEIQRQLGQ
jgi:hypothetical protein